MKRYWAHLMKSDTEEWEGDVYLADEADAEITKHNEQEEYLIKATTKIQCELIQAREEIARKDKALKVYADKENWQCMVIDSYSGAEWRFDWDGDLMDNPWEIAHGVLEKKNEIYPATGLDDNMIANMRWMKKQKTTHDELDAEKKE